MDAVPFNIQVLRGDPLLVMTPYGVSIVEMMNIIIESLRRSQNFNIGNQNNVKPGLYSIYTDRKYPIDETNIPIYQGGRGVILITAVLDEYKYSSEIIPIYIAEWGIRRNILDNYYDWIKPNTLVILYPQFLPSKQPSRIIPHFIQVGSNSIKELTTAIVPPCVVISDTEEIPLIQSTLRDITLPVYDKNRIGMFLQTRYGVLVTNDIDSIQEIPAEIPLHIIHLDSDNGLQLFIDHFHDILHIYIQPNTSDMDQYNLLIKAVNDCNQVFFSLINNSRSLTIDAYNNLYVE